MSYDIKTIDALVREFGGNTAIAEWLGITPEAVSMWKLRDNIPSGWHWKFESEASRQGKKIHPAVFGRDEDVAPYLKPARASA